VLKSEIIKKKGPAGPFLLCNAPCSAAHNPPCDCATMKYSIGIDSMVFSREVGIMLLSVKTNISKRNFFCLASGGGC
jgi:hypothetical protein